MGDLRHLAQEMAPVRGAAIVRAVGAKPENFKTQAERLPYGNEREALERKARQLDIASHINEWVSSPGLQPPLQWKPE